MIQNVYHLCNQRQLEMKTAKDQRHKDGDKRPFWALSLPAYLGGLETKNVRNKRKKYWRQDDPINFPLTASNRELCHDSFQYSTNKNSTFPFTGSCCKVSISLC